MIFKSSDQSCLIIDSFLILKISYVHVKEEFIF